MSGGDFQITPAYDVMPAHPLVAKRQLQKQVLKMAMTARGKSRHYQWSRILYRNWISTAGRCRFSPGEMAGVIAEHLLNRMHVGV